MSEQKLLMDDTELSISFRKAKNKREQIGVLADLNLCAPYVIAERLEGMGLLTGTGLIPENFSRKYDAVSSATSGGKTMKHRYPDKRATRNVSPMDELRAMELFKEGLDDLQMAETLGVSPTRVKHWRQRMHLLRPRGGGRPRMKKTEETEVEEKTEIWQAQAGGDERDGSDTARAGAAAERDGGDAHRVGVPGDGDGTADAAGDEGGAHHQRLAGYGDRGAQHPGQRHAAGGWDRDGGVTMVEYIRRDAIGLTDFEIALCEDYKAVCRSLLEKIDRIPAADVAPVVRGRWLEGNKRQPCSICRYKGMRSWNYCPNCGADMREAQDV